MAKRLGLLSNRKPAGCLLASSSSIEEDFLRGLVSSMGGVRQILGLEVREMLGRGLRSNPGGMNSFLEASYPGEGCGVTAVEGIGDGYGVTSSNGLMKPANGTEAKTVF